jgi:glycosyltransferase involved in cell wall biosynthesis
MSDSPDVSVVMSVYNGADHLRETLDSVLAQEEVELELIVINDGSTDQSATILEEYASRDERVRVLQQKNQGLTRSLIRGCSEARGKYIARQDVGDVSERRRLLLQKLALDKSSEVAFVSCWTEFCGPEWELLYLVKGTGRASLPTYVISDREKHGVIDGPTHHGSVMFRKERYLKVGGYRPEFYYGQDWDLWYRLAEAAKFQTVEHPLYKARVLLDSISTSQKAGQDAISALSRAALRQRQIGMSEQEVLHRASLIIRQDSKGSRANSRASGLYFVGECLRKNGDDRALAYFRQAISNSPLFLKAWIRILQHKLGGNSKKGATKLSTE